MPLVQTPGRIVQSQKYGEFIGFCGGAVYDRNGRKIPTGSASVVTASGVSPDSFAVTLQSIAGFDNRSDITVALFADLRYSSSWTNIRLAGANGYGWFLQFEAWAPGTTKLAIGGTWLGNVATVYPNRFEGAPTPIVIELSMTGVGSITCLTPLGVWSATGSQAVEPVQSTAPASFGIVNATNEMRPAMCAVLQGINRTRSLELLSNPWQLFRSERRVFYSLSAPAGIPTLSAATVTNITSTSATPRVTLTF